MTVSMQVLDDLYTEQHSLHLEFISSHNAYTQQCHNNSVEVLGLDDVLHCAYLPFHLERSRLGTQDYLLSDFISSQITVWRW